MASTPNKLSLKLWKQAERRETEERERIRLAVADGKPPLSEELALAIVAHNDQQAREILRSHAGYRLKENGVSGPTDKEITQSLSVDRYVP